MATSCQPVAGGQAHRLAACGYDPGANGAPPAPAEQAPAYFASTGTGLRGFKTRHRLALLYQAQGRPADAEARHNLEVHLRHQGGPPAERQAARS